MDGARGYYIQWNKVGRKWQVLNDFTHLWSVPTKQDRRSKTAVAIIDAESDW